MSVFLFEITTPESKALSAEIRLALLPGSAGRFGVMARHMPLVGALQEGLIKIVYADEREESFYLTSGFMETDGLVCSVLASEVFDLQKLSPAEINTQQSKLLNDLAQAHLNSERKLIQDRLALLDRLLAYLA